MSRDAIVYAMLLKSGGARRIHVLGHILALGGFCTHEEFTTTTCACPHESKQTRNTWRNTTF